MKGLFGLVASASVVAWAAAAPSGVPSSPKSTKAAEVVHEETAQLTGQASAPASSLALWYRQPARTWNEALPVGNGRMGAMVFGGVAHEDIQLNENSLWEGRVRPAQDNPEALHALPRIRSLLFQNQDEEATRLITETMMGRPPRILSYQPLGELRLEFPDATKVENYRRTLDLETGIVTVEYDQNGVHFTREIFASAPDDVIVMRLSSTQPSRLRFDALLTRAKDAHTVAASGDDILRLGGQVHYHYIGDPPSVPGMRFECVIETAAPGQGGSFQPVPGGGVEWAPGAFPLAAPASGAPTDSVVLLIAAATDYRGGDPLQLCRQALDRVHGKTWEELRARHLADYRRLFDRVSLHLGAAATAGGDGSLPTDERLQRLHSAWAAHAPAADADPGLFTLYFQYGRYLLMSSSRPGQLPNNLQGLWNAEMKAPWNSDYHTNINIQMNYWPAEVCNLAECHEPLFDLMDRLVGPGSRTAQIEYGARGWVVHHLTDPFGFTAPADGPQGVWPMGAAWLAQHPWEHYAFGMDKDFLLQRAYPLMRGAAQFILDFLVKAPEGTAMPGRLVTAPSHSPENSFFLPDGRKAELTYGATMDLEIIHDLLTHCIEATQVLNIDPDFRAQCQQALAQLAPLQISPKTGRLQEWIEDFPEVDPYHRHTSHLFAVYPGDQITLDGTPELAAAARKSLIARGDAHATEWSLAWRAALWARFQDSDRAYGQLRELMAKDLYPNMFNKYPPFQIDGNLGATAALAEMLVQSQGGLVTLLPALPAQWPSGQVKGLRARGGFTVDFDWEGGRITRATALSTAGQTLRYRLSPAGPVKELPTEAGRSYRL